MKTKLVIACLLSLAILAISGNAFAEKAILKPEKVATITSTEDSLKTRVLVYFKMPEKLKTAGITLDFAKLIFDASIADSEYGQIDIFPVTTSWKDAGSISWKGLWEKEGGDYSRDRAGKSVLLKQTKGKSRLRSNVTHIVQGWLDGVVDNKGLIIIASYESESKEKVASYSLFTEGVQLLIHYTPKPEMKTDLKGMY